MGLMAKDRSTAECQPVGAERLSGRHREGRGMRAPGQSGGTELFDVTIFHALSRARIGDVVENPLNVVKAGLDRQSSFLRES